jgi:hypothetical protein
VVAVLLIGTKVGGKAILFRHSHRFSSFDQALLVQNSLLVVEELVPATWCQEFASAMPAATTAVEGNATKTTTMNVVTVKRAKPEPAPYRNSVGEIRVWVRVVE